MSFDRMQEFFDLSDFHDATSKERIDRVKTKLFLPERDIG